MVREKAISISAGADDTEQTIDLHGGAKKISYIFIPTTGQTSYASGMKIRWEDGGESTILHEVAEGPFEFQDTQWYLTLVVNTPTVGTLYVRWWR